MSHVSTFHQASISQTETEAQPPVKPMTLWLSVLLFAAPAAITFALFHGMIPLLERAGTSPLESFIAAITLATGMLFAAALITYHRIEGRPMTWRAFGERLWYPRLRLRDILWAVGVFLVGGAGIFAMTPVRNLLIGAGIIPLPASIPLLIDPNMQISSDTLNRFAGGSMVGRWDLVFFYAVSFFFNNVGEELWWRGIIFPRQALTHGRWTWLVHGVLWALFHAFKYWDILVVLPLALAISFATQKTRSNWAALIAHSLGNVSFFLILIAAAAGSM